MTHVDGVDAGRPALEQAVGEPAGRRADVDGAAALDGDGEALERSIELLATATDERRRRPDEGDRLVRCHQAGRFVGRSTRDEHGPGLDGLACVLA